MEENTTKKGPRVLVISASVGSGHNQAAKAVMEALAAARPDATIDYLDMMEQVPRYFRSYYAGGFALCMTHFNWLYGLGFWMTNRPQSPRRGLAELMRLQWERLALGRVEQLLLESQPDLIIHTHFLAPPLAGRLIESGRLRSKQITVVTDVDVHRWWFSRQVQHYFVAAEHGRETLMRWGIEPGRMTVSGIPVRPKWLAAYDRENIYRQWSLPRDKKIVLLSGGTEFTCGPIVKIARDLVRASTETCVVVLAGRNKKLLGELTGLRLPSDRLMPMGFTDRLPELAEVASLMVTKPGGVTTAECLSRGLAMVFLRPVPGQEAGNARFFEREGAGLIARTPDDVVAQVTRLVTNPQDIVRMSANARRLFRPAAQTIADHAAGILGGQNP